MLIYKTLLGLTPPYLRYLLQPSSSAYNTCSTSHIQLKVPKAHTSPGRSYFQFAAASDWNDLQQTGQFYLHLFIQRLNHGHSYWHLLLPCVMLVVSPFLPFVLLSVPNNVCTMFVPLPCCAAAMLCCYCIVIMLCCYHAVLSCGAAILRCCLRSLFWILVGRHCK
jgi:hypothetical protein